MKLSKRVLAVSMAGVLSAGMAMNAAAAPSGEVNLGDGSRTEVKAGVIVSAIEAKISVSVPSLFSFVMVSRDSEFN